MRMEEVEVIFMEEVEVLGVVWYLFECDLDDCSGWENVNYEFFLECIVSISGWERINSFNWISDNGMLVFVIILVYM